MALTAAEEEKIRKLLAREDEQNRNKYLSSLESFAAWLEAVARIAIAIKDIAVSLFYFRSLFGF
ncbi:hypothetical protein [Planktothrix agardhii]|uniref:hypothetical protein n=1 Tax=Planktothrix agardhii TaxID=1160 RepID=UPI00040F878B|nr:hypothetical protein [Planktothrix agardhii]